MGNETPHSSGRYTPNSTISLTPSIADSPRHKDPYAMNDDQSQFGGFATTVVSGSRYTPEASFLDDQTNAYGGTNAGTDIQFDTHRMTEMLDKMKRENPAQLKRFARSMQQGHAQTPAGTAYSTMGESTRYDNNKAYNQSNGQSHYGGATSHGQTGHSAWSRLAAGNTQNNSNNAQSHANYNSNNYSRNIHGGYNNFKAPFSKPGPGGARQDYYRKDGQDRQDRYRSGGNYNNYKKRGYNESSSTRR